MANTNQDTERKLPVVKKTKGPKGPNMFKKLGKFFRDCWIELKKIVWPGFKTVRNNTGTVLLIILILGAFILALDYGLTFLLNLFMNIPA